MTKIEWTHRPGTIGVSWNPIRAKNKTTGGVGHFCEHVSEGCRNCYAERMQPRFGNPVRYARQDRAKVEICLDEAAIEAPLRWRKPRTVFVCSMTDLYGEWVTDEMLDWIKAVQALTPQHTYIELTKRAERMREYLTDQSQARCNGRGEAVMWIAPTIPLESLAWPPPNLWLGVSVEDKKTANERISLLHGTPAAVRFISYEPALGPIDGVDLSGLDWVIAGGESGPKARPAHPDWFRQARDQCAAAGVAFFFKQWGEWASVSEVEGEGRHFSFPDGATVRRAGKAKAGRMLDGRTHDEWPAP